MHHDSSTHKPPLTMFGPDFPFAYDGYVAHGDGIGTVPEPHHGREVAVVGGGLAGMVAAHELLAMGLKPIVYEAGEIGGRMRSHEFDGHPGVIAEMGAMRFPPSSTTLFHYLDALGLTTTPFPNPLADCTASTVIDLKGRSHYATTAEDLPEKFGQVALAWQHTLAEQASMASLKDAIRRRDVTEIKRIWNPLIRGLDDQTFYGFLAQSRHFSSFEHRELFGQVGFGTGGWDTDFPNSILEVLRVVSTEADDNHRGIDGGCQQLPLRLWNRSPQRLTHWPAGTTVESVNGGRPWPRVTEIRRNDSGQYTVVDAGGGIRRYAAVVVTAQSWLLLNRIRCADDLFPAGHWTAIERTHYMGSSKVFALVDRPFWRDRDPETGRDAVSMTLTDRMPRGTYLIDNGEDRPGVICLSYTWCDDSAKLLTLDASERMDLMIKSLREIYPRVDFHRHVISTPVTVSWETERNFMGAFKANLPGHYRYQQRLFSHFMQAGFDARHRGIFLAGDDISWTAGWAEGAVQTALNAVWGVMHHLGGATSAHNPGPGDRYAEIAPVVLDDVDDRS
ncbi:monoamine oxidase [Mycolicibacterium sp. 624]